MAASSARVALLLVSLAGALPFLFLEHRQPILSFYDEWLALALAASALIAFALGARVRAVAVPEISLWLLALAGWLAVQGAARQPAFPQLPLAGMVYLVTAAALAWLGHELARNLGAARVADTIAAAVLAGAVVNAAIGIAQFYGIPQALEGFVARTGGPRIVGHVGQANLFAGYLALGEASLAYLVGRARLPAVAACVAGALLVLASACSQSRSALAFSIWIAALALVTRRRAGPEWRPMARCALLLGSFTLLAAAALPRVHDALDMPSAQFAFDRLVDPSVVYGETRPDAWALAFRLFLDSPWLGVGWGEFAGAAFQAGLPAKLAAVSPVWTSPHNAPLQVLAEAGIVGAALAFIAALRWWRRVAVRLAGSPSPPEWWVAAVAGVVCLHALIEYPLWYAHVLALLCLVAGIASTPATEVAARPARIATAFGGILLCALLAWSLRDDLRLDRAHLVATGSTLAGPPQVAEARESLQVVGRGPLGALTAPWLYRSLPFDAHGLGAKLDLGDRVLRRWPAPPAIARHAAFLMLTGRRDEAMQLIDHAVATLPGTAPALEAALRPLAAGSPQAIAPLLARIESARRSERR